MSKIGTLPLTLNAEEEFNIIILDSIYTIRQIWNTIGFWTIDIFDKENSPIALGVKLIASSFILKQFPQVDFDIFITGEVEPDRNNLSELNIEVHKK